MIKKHVALTMEQKAKGPYFHMHVDIDHAAFKKKLADCPGDMIFHREVFIYPSEVSGGGVDRTKLNKAIELVKEQKGTYLNSKETAAILAALEDI